MIAKTGITDRLRATLAKELKQDVNVITPEHALRDDLGLNSLDAIELMFKIEEEFDLSIPDEDMQKLATVGDVITYLERRLNEAPLKPGTKPAARPTTKSAAAPSSMPPRAAAQKIAQPKRAATAPPKRAVARTTKSARPSLKSAKPKGSRDHA
jgi:acyl carrier protein